MKARLGSAESFQESHTNAILKTNTLSGKIKSQILKDKETFADKMRNHLTPITSYSEMILEGKFGEIPESQRKRIELMKIQAEKMFELLNTMEDIPLKTDIHEKKVKNLELKLESLNHDLKDKTQTITILKHLSKLNSKSFDQKLLKHDIVALSSEITNVQTKLKKDNHKIVYVFGILGLLMMGSFVILQSAYLALDKDHFDVNNLHMRIQNAHTKIDEDHTNQLKSNYLIQNLKGDTIDTWVSWNLVKGQTLYVNIINGDKYPEQAEIIRNSILSTESIEIDDNLQHKGPKGTYSTYFMGWNGALDYASTIKDTKSFIPTNLHVIESKLGQGDITIELSNLRNGDGYSGYTKSITDANNNQILKSHIVIYEIENLSSSQLEAIIMHEMGHGLGLAHSSDPEDLMAPVITTNYPYISECDIDAIVLLYDGGETSQVICEN